MSVVTVSPPGADAALSVDHCQRCGGHWLDAHEARHVAPFFAYLERRQVEIELLGKPSNIKCLRCQTGMQLFRLMDVEIDYCTVCGGLWLDGDEAKDRVNLNNAKVTHGHVYRTVQKTQSLERVRCAACERAVPTAQTYAAGVGLICRGCFFALAQRRQEWRAAVEQGASELRASPAAPAAPSEPLLGLPTVEVLEGLRKLLAATHRALFGGPS